MKYSISNTSCGKEPQQQHNMHSDLAKKEGWEPGMNLIEPSNISTKFRNLCNKDWCIKNYQNVVASTKFQIWLFWLLKSCILHINTELTMYVTLNSNFLTVEDLRKAQWGTKTWFDILFYLSISSTIMVNIMVNILYRELNYNYHR